MKHLMMTMLLIAAGTADAANAANTASADIPPTTYWRGSTWTDPDRGFLWYAPPRPAKEAPKEEPKATPTTRYEHMTNKQLGKEIERLLDIAVEQQSPAAWENAPYVSSRIFLKSASGMLPVTNGRITRMGHAGDQHTLGVFRKTTTRQ